MLMHVKPFTYLSTAQNSNNEHLTHGKDKYKI